MIQVVGTGGGTAWKESWVHGFKQEHIRKVRWGSDQSVIDCEAAILRTDWTREGVDW